LDVRRHVDPHRAARLGGRRLRPGARKEAEAGQRDAALAREAEQVAAAEGRPVALEDVEDAASVGHDASLLCLSSEEGRIGRATAWLMPRTSVSVGTSAAVRRGLAKAKVLSPTRYSLQPGESSRNSGKWRMSS